MGWDLDRGTLRIRGDARGFYGGDVHHSPRSSMMISERGLPGALPIRSANLRRSSSDTGSGGIGPRGRGRIKPFATSLWIRTSMLSPGSSDTSGPSGKTWMRTLCCSRRLSGCSGRSIPFSYTAVTISTVISLTFLTHHASRSTFHVLRHYTTKGCPKRWSRRQRHSDAGLLAAVQAVPGVQGASTNPTPTAASPAMNTLSARPRIGVTRAGRAAGSKARAEAAWTTSSP
jgi:hypothetical protein